MVTKINSIRPAEEKDKTTTIRVLKSTLVKIATFGNKGDTYEEILIKLMNQIEKENE